jgi:hypothetical protein
MLKTNFLLLILKKGLCQSFSMAIRLRIRHSGQPDGGGKFVADLKL